MQEQVCVRVDQAWHKRGAPEIDDLYACRMGHLRSDFADLRALDEHLAWGDEFARSNVEEMRGVQHGHTALLRVRWQHKCGERKEMREAEWLHVQQRIQEKVRTAANPFAALRETTG